MNVKLAGATAQTPIDGATAAGRVVVTTSAGM